MTISIWMGIWREVREPVDGNRDFFTAEGGYPGLWS